MTDSIFFFIGVCLLLGYFYAEFDYFRKTNFIEKERNKYGNEITDASLQNLKNNRTDHLVSNTLTAAFILFFGYFIVLGLLAGVMAAINGVPLDTYPDCYNEAGRKICS